MGVTQVVRGSDLLSTPRQRYLLSCWAVPRRSTAMCLLAPTAAAWPRDRPGVGALQQRFARSCGLAGPSGGADPGGGPVSPEELVPLFAWEKLPRRDIAMEP